MTATLRDLLLQLGLNSYHSAFLETGVTEGSVPVLLSCEESELKILLLSITNMLPFHRVMFLKGIRELREATRQRQQTTNSGTSTGEQYNLRLKILTTSINVILVNNH